MNVSWNISFAILYKHISIILSTWWISNCKQPWRSQHPWFSIKWPLAPGIKKKKSWLLACADFHCTDTSKTVNFNNNNLTTGSQNSQIFKNWLSWSGSRRLQHIIGTLRLCKKMYPSLPWASALKCCYREYSPWTNGTGRISDRCWESSVFLVRHFCQWSFIRINHVHLSTYGL